MPGARKKGVTSRCHALRRWKSNSSDDLRLADDFECAVVVAVIPVNVMEVPPNEIIRVIAMWDRFVPASGAMAVRSIVTLRGLFAFSGVGRGHRYSVLVHVVFVRMMKMAIMEIVDMPFMLHRDMAAIWTVLVGMSGVNFAVFHNDFLKRDV